MNQIYDSLTMLENEIKNLNSKLQDERGSNAFFRLITKSGIKSNIEKSRKLQSCVNNLKQKIEEQAQE